MISVKVYHIFLVIKPQFIFYLKTFLRIVLQDEKKPPIMEINEKKINIVN